MKEYYIRIMNEDVTYDVWDKEDCINAIIEEYEKYDVSMCDILASVEIHGFSVEDVFEIYAAVKYRADSDTVVLFSDEPNTVCESIKDIDYTIIYGELSDGENIGSIFTKEEKSKIADCLGISYEKVSKIENYHKEEDVLSMALWVYDNDMESIIEDVRTIKEKDFKEYNTDNSFEIMLRKNHNVVVFKNKVLFFYE